MWKPLRCSDARMRSANSRSQHSSLRRSWAPRAVTLDGSDAKVPTLLSYARVRNVSKLVVGASRRQGLSRSLKRSLGDRLIEHAAEIDVTLVHIQVQAGGGRTGAADPRRRYPQCAGRRTRRALTGQQLWLGRP